MNWIKVNEFVEEWVAQRQLPPDLKGKTLALVEFENEANCQFFYPDRTQHAQEVFISALVRFVRARRGRIEMRTITPDHYRAWLAGERLKDSQEVRSQWIESRYQVIGE